MKSILSILIATLITVVSAPQGCGGNEEKAQVEPPRFPGGNEALMEYFNANLEYPEQAKQDSLQGRVMVMFVVNKDGHISHTKVVRGISPLLDSAAVRCVRNMPAWEPATHNGNPTPVMYQVPVIFLLD